MGRSKISIATDEDNNNNNNNTKGKARSTPRHGGKVPFHSALGVFLRLLLHGDMPACLALLCLDPPFSYQHPRTRRRQFHPLIIDIGVALA